MLARHLFRAPVLVLLSGLFLCQGCGEISSKTEVTVTPTVTFLTPTFLSSTGTVPAPTIPADLLTAVQIVVNAIEANQPEQLRTLIGDEGVAPGGFAQGVGLKGFNNADEIIAAFDEALDRSNPVCEGYVTYMGALPDKATLVYRGMEFDWSQWSLSGASAGGTTLTLFNMPEGWRLIYITPFDFEWGPPILGPMQDCPS